MTTATSEQTDHCDACGKSVILGQHCVLASVHEFPGARKEPQGFFKIFLCEDCYHLHHSVRLGQLSRICEGCGSDATGC